MHSVPKGQEIKCNTSIAAGNFSWNLINGDVFDQSFGILPHWVSARFAGIGNVSYPFSILRNTSFKKLAPIIEAFKVFLQIPGKSSVWFYNINALNATLIYLLRTFKPSVKLNAIVLDYTPDNPKNARYLSLINACHGRICLASTDEFNSVNSVCLPGVTSAEVKDAPKITEISWDFLISGMLGENISSLTTLLKVFSRHPELRLHITGMKADETLIKSFTDQHPNIIYYGQSSFEKYRELLTKCPFLLSTRNVNYPENRCNFPSKIIEGLVNNRIIISTIHYPQLGRIKYLEVGNDEAAFEDNLLRIASMNKEVLLTFANQESATRESFNVGVWNKVMSDIENYRAK